MKNEQIHSLQAEQQQFFQLGKTRDIAFRIDALLKLRRLIEQNEEHIIKALHDDLHKSKTEAFTSEIGYVLQLITYTIKKLKQWSSPQKVKTTLINQPASSYFRYEPYGSVLIISPWNYPFGLLFTPLVGAIAAGNCVIAKPSELAIHTSNLLYHLINKNFNREYLAVVEGDADVTQALINEKINSIFFTGSTRVGKLIMKSAAEFLIPITLELGGKNPCIVDNDIDIEVAVKRIVWGKFFNAGQTCVAPDYVLIHQSIKKQFLDKTVEVINEFYGSNPDGKSDFSHIINHKHFDRLTELLHHGTIITEGVAERESLFIPPTVITDVTHNSPLMQEEIFGPILPVIPFDNLDDEIRRLQYLDKPLCLYFFSKNKASQQKIIENTTSGTVCINGTIHSIMSDELPFGGVGQSGMGTYHGKSSFETFSHKKSVLKKSFWGDMGFLYPPYKTPLDIVKKAVRILY